jgi:hypothetical protein
MHGQQNIKNSYEVFKTDTQNPSNTHSYYMSIITTRQAIQETTIAMRRVRVTIVAVEKQ